MAGKFGRFRRSEVKKPVFQLSSKLPALTIAILYSLLTSCTTQAQSEDIFRRDELLMGTVVSLQVVHRDSKTASRLIDMTFSLMKELADRMDVHREDSEVSRLNREASFKPVKVSRELFEVLSLAVEVSKISNGAFDITVGPLIKLWPIYKKSGFAPPDPEVIQRTLQKVGWRYLLLNSNDRTVKFAKEGLSIDLGGIAKGYIVDKAVEFLKSHEVRGALVNAGGDIYALGTAPHGKPWRVGIQHPREPDKLVAVLELKDQGVVTSGDYERCVIKNGIRYTHIIDPRTGFTVRETASVTVVGKSTAFIDALATAIMVEGAEKGIPMVKSLPSVEALIITQNKENPSELIFTPTPGFMNYATWTAFNGQGS